MDSVQSVTQQVIIIFFYIAVGILANKLKIVTIEATRSYSNLLLSVVVPALLIVTYQREFDSQTLLGLGLAFLLAILFHLLAMVLVPLLIRKREDENYRVEQMGAVYSNCGYMAFPLLLATVGEIGVFYGGAFIGVFNVALWTHGVYTLCGRGSLNVKKILLNPGVLGFVAGLSLYLLHISLPSLVCEALNGISSLNTPLAMMITGIFLGEIRSKELLEDGRIYFSAVIRLVALPLLLFAVVKLIGMPNWFEGARTVAFSMILCSACPSAASTILMVARLGLNGAHGAKIIAVSTLFCIVTLPFLTYLLTLFL